MHKVQYTIRNVPSALDQAIRKRAAQTGKSFNQTVVDLLALQAFGSTKPVVDKNFDWLYNQKTLDPAFDDTVSKLSQIDKKLWR